jgi:hypothetical protein
MHRIFRVNLRQCPLEGVNRLDIIGLFQRADKGGKAICALTTSYTGNNVANRFSDPDFLITVDTHFGRKCNRCNATSVYRLLTLSFEDTESGKDRFRPYPVMREVRNHVQSIFHRGFL